MAGRARHGRSRGRASRESSRRADLAEAGTEGVASGLDAGSRAWRRAAWRRRSTARWVSTSMRWPAGWAPTGARTRRPTSSGACSPARSASRASCGSSTGTAIRGTWFIPGHSIETFPDQTRMVVDAGHEIGAHGYSHENPVAMTPRQEEDVLARCVDLIERVSGKRPRGYVAPWWEMSASTGDLLLQYGFSYDNSQAYNDFTPFYARVGDTWTKVDYAAEASSWMRPLVRGREIDVVEIAANWYLDDLPPMMFIKASPNSHEYVSPRHLGEMWHDEFDWIYREMDYAVFALTIHPDVSGRPGSSHARATHPTHQRPRRDAVARLRGDRGRLPSPVPTTSDASLTA